MADYPMDTAVTDHLLATTRAVRKRLDLERPVEREVLLECLRLAVQSPTPGNAQNWHWMVVTDPDKRVRLKELYDGMARPYLESQAEAAADPQTQRVYQSAVYLLNILDRVPVHVIPCVEGRLENPEPFAAASFYGAILPAAWSFMLAARSRGLGTAWTTLHLANEADDRGAAGDPRRHDPGGADPDGLLHRRRLQARRTAAGRGHHLLGHLGRYWGVTLTMARESEA